MASPRRKAQWGHYPPVVPEVQLDDSGITVAYNTNGALEISTDYGLVDTANPGDGIIFTGPDVDDGSYDISIDATYFDGVYLRNDGDTGIGAYEFTGVLTNNGDVVSVIDLSGDISARLFKSSYAEQITTPASTADVCFRNDNITDNAMRFMDRNSLNNFVHGGGTFVHVSRDTSQTLTNGASTQVFFSNEITDRLGEFDTGTGRFTANNTGIYLFNSVVLVQKVTWPATKILQMNAYKNGSSVILGQIFAAHASANMLMACSISCAISLAATDYVDMRVYHDFGSILNTYNSAGYSWLTVSRVG